MTTPPPDFVEAFLPLAREQIERERAEAPEVARRDRREFRMRYRRLDNGALYGDVFAPWQEEHLFLPMDRGMSLWDEAGRGHDRTDGEGWWISTELQYGPPGQVGVVIAADKDQAALPLERCDRYRRDSPWLFPDITVHKGVVYGPNGSKCVVMSSDAASSLGIKPSWVFAEELGAWPARGEALWTSVVGACAKLRAPIRVLTNAGVGKVGNWRWTAREAFRALAAEHPDRYHFWAAPGWVAEWSRGLIGELRTLFPSPRDQARFIDNVWLEGDEYPAFSSEDIERVFARPYTEDGRAVTAEGDAAPRRIVAAVQSADVGLTDDALALGTLLMTEDADVWLADPLALAGKPGAPASILAMDAHLEGVARRRALDATVFDPHEAQATMQKLGPIIRAEEYRYTPASKRAMYSAFLGKVRAGKFHALPGMLRRRHANGQEYDLRREMVEAIEKIGASGSHLDHPEGGHDDGCCMVGQGLVRLGECSLAAPAVASTPDAPPDRRWRSYRDRALGRN